PCAYRLRSISRRMDVTESNPPPHGTALARRDAGLHLAPRGGFWCLAQSNTNSGHGIPSGPLAASEYCVRLAVQRKCRSRDREHSTPESLRRESAWCLPPGKSGLSYAEIIGTFGGLHGNRYPLHTQLNPDYRIVMSAIKRAPVP